MCPVAKGNAKTLMHRLCPFSTDWHPKGWAHPLQLDIHGAARSRPRGVWNMLLLT